MKPRAVVSRSSGESLWRLAKPGLSTYLHRVPDQPVDQTQELVELLVLQELALFAFC
jgi:hypothetical protein